MARQPCPIYHPEVSYPSERGFQRENQHFFRQEKPNLDASRNDVRSRPLSHPEDEKRFSVSDHHGSGPTVNSHIKPKSEYIHQDRKRLKVVDGKCPTVRQPSPSYQAQAKYPSEHGVYPVVGEPKKENPDSSNGKLPHLLYLPEDEEHLTELHCFVRKHCVFIFCATKKHVGTPRRGRKKALRLGQIGIGCLYCRSISAEDKLKGSTYFPTCISGIYNATMIIQQRHFPVCPSVSREDFCKYTKLKGLTARSASTKEYWISAAKKKGLVDTSSGELRASLHCVLICLFASLTFVCTLRCLWQFLLNMTTQVYSSGQVIMSNQVHLDSLAFPKMQDDHMCLWFAWWNPPTEYLQQNTPSSL
ncbi:hypothetical protein ACHAW5_001985 [Stephanodiscus triporus]|uniref:Uncharacterized protein n=1 Tax=Stephanodiscus triporus TaxID=2934178 RepID=A0ABD3QU52_9STRA